MKLATASTDRTVYDFKVLLEPHKEAGGYVVSCPALEGKSLKEVIDQIIDELRGEFPNAEFLLDGEIYNDEDTIIKIYAPDKDLNQISDKASELSLQWELKMGYFILPIVNAIEAYPIG